MPAPKTPKPRRQSTISLCGVVSVSLKEEAERLMYFSLQAVSLKKTERKTLSDCLRLKCVDEFLPQVPVNNFPCGSSWHALGLQKNKLTLYSITMQTPKAHLSALVAYQLLRNSRSFLNTVCASGCSDKSGKLFLSSATTCCVPRRKNIFTSCSTLSVDTKAWFRS